MTLDEIDARIAALRAQQRQHLDNANACQGAIEDCLYWRSEMQKQQGQKPKAGKGGKPKPKPGGDTPVPD